MEASNGAEVGGSPTVLSFGIHASQVRYVACSSRVHDRTARWHRTYRSSGCRRNGGRSQAGLDEGNRPRRSPANPSAPLAASDRRGKRHQFPRRTPRSPRGIRGAWNSPQSRTRPRRLRTRCGVSWLLGYGQRDADFHTSETSAQGGATSLAQSLWLSKWTHHSRHRDRSRHGLRGLSRSPAASAARRLGDSRRGRPRRRMVTTLPGRALARRCRRGFDGRHCNRSQRCVSRRVALLTR
jgi:hypothetical protein